MLDHCTKIVVQHFITDKLIHVIRDIPDDEIESNKENMFRDDRDAESDQANINGSDSDYADESVMDVVLDAAVVGGEDKHKARAGMWQLYLYASDASPWSFNGFYPHSFL